MTQDEAKQLAEKREKHKSKNMRHMSWQAIEENGAWTVKLLETPQTKFNRAVQEMDEAKEDAAVAIVTGNMDALMLASRAHLLARCDAVITRYETVHGKVPTRSEEMLRLFDPTDAGKPTDAE